MRHIYEKGKRISERLLTGMRNADYKHCLHNISNRVVSLFWNCIEIIGLVIIGIAITTVIAISTTLDLLFGGKNE